MRNKFGQALLPLLLFLSSFGLMAKTTTSWWPEQKKPEAIIVCREATGFRDLTLANSISGLAAKTVNEGSGTEAIWIESSNPNYLNYFTNLLDRLGLKSQPRYMNVWQLLEYFTGKGAVKGYVLYDFSSPISVNIATTRAGLLRSALVEKAQEAKVKKLGLKCLFDATDPALTEEDNFREIKSLLSNRQICILNPKVPNNRDFAIAHNSMVCYGVTPFLNEVLEWVEPLSPVIGWNSGPESYHIMPCTEWGLVNTVSDFCQNLLLMSCDNGNVVNAKFRSFDPSKIRWKDKKKIYHSFVMSDGDNMQWMLGNFISNQSYWASPYASSLSMSYTTCTANMTMAAPDGLRQIVATQQPNTGVIEYGGGYYYPDKFACKRPNREELLRKLARTVNIRMKETGISVLGFICMRLFTEEAMQAYRIFAEEIDCLSGMMALQYAPYNKGDGKILWIPDKNGINIPVCTAKFQVWANLHCPGSDDPLSVCRLVNSSLPDTEKKTFNWTIVHAWSKFERGQDGELVDIKDKNAGGEKGILPIHWGSEALDKSVKLVPVDELMWRIRMYYYPEQTNLIINKI